VDELAKLRWQCRRGTRELDLLLNNYLETRYPIANEDEKARFIALLQLDDTELLKQLGLLSSLNLLHVK
jgi:antitoxin CptB